MPRFVLMTRLAPESLNDAEVRRAMGRAWLKKVQAACPEVVWIAHYAILGPYDFMDAESWQAMPYDDFLNLLEEVEP